MNKLTNRQATAFTLSQQPAMTPTTAPTPTQAPVESFSVRSMTSHSLRRSDSFANPYIQWFDGGKDARVDGRFAFMPEVLVIANILHQKEGPFSEALGAAGFSIRFPKDGYRQLTEPELAAELGNAVATIAGSEPYTPASFAANPQLRALARTGVGYDSIDIPSATKSRVAVCVTPGANHDAVAEQTFALLLAVGRHVIANHLMVAGGGFKRAIPVPMRGRTLGLVGCGRIGKAV